jgi:putative transposase
MSDHSKSYSFYCKDLNKGKIALVKDSAIELRTFRNSISQTVCKEFPKYMEMGLFDWIKIFRTRLPNCNNQHISNAIEDVFISYKNKKDSFLHGIRFKLQKKIKVEHYKVNGKTFRKGDVRLFEIELGETRTTRLRSYLARYWSDDLISWLEVNKDADEKKSKLRNDALDLFKRHPKRITRLIFWIRERTINRLTEHSIEFKSESFRGCNEMKGSLLNRNDNERSIFGAVITFSGQKTENGKLHVPVKYSEEHHGEISDYDKKPDLKNCKLISYTICPEKKGIRVVLFKKVDQEPVVLGKTDYYGIDTNVKHNLFVDKEGKEIDYDRNIFNDYVKFLKKMDAKTKDKKARGESHNISIRDMSVQKRWQVRIRDELKRKARLLVDQAISLGKDHIVMEDLGTFAKSFSRSEEFEGFKYSRLVRLLNLADLKRIVKSIAQKKGLQVTFVQPHYTSQTCKCGHISRDNRKTQEVFECEECGSKMNADSHAASMIEDRMSEDVLRVKLLSFVPGEGFVPRKLKKEAIRGILYDCYSKNSGVG